MFLALARRCSRAADSRTCDTEPGAAESCSSQSVWIESTTQTSGAVASMVAQTVSSSVSASTPTPAVAPSRSARRRTCSGDSSPATSSTGRCAPIAPSIAAVRLDLPTPGSPPSSTSEPGTRPPPSTRSSSAMPVPMRAAALVSTDASGTTTPAAAPLRRAPLRASSDAGACSTSVAKAPQSGQRPSQRACSPPHSPHR